MYTHTHTTHTHTHTHTHPHHTPTHTHVHTGMLRGAGVRAVDDGVASVNGSTFRYIRTCALSVCGRGRVVASSCVFRHLLVCLYLSVYLSIHRETSGRPRETSIMYVQRYRQTYVCIGHSICSGTEGHGCRATTGSSRPWLRIRRGTRLGRRWWAAWTVLGEARRLVPAARGAGGGDGLRWAIG